MAGNQLDLIVANDVSASDSGFSVDTNRVTLIDSAGEANELPLMKKQKQHEEFLHAVSVSR